MPRRVTRLIQLVLAMVATMALVFGTSTPTYAVSYGVNLLTTTDTTTGSGKTMEYSQTIALSSADIIRANKGDLVYVANVHIGANGSRTVTAKLTVQCKDASGTVLAEFAKSDKSYWVKHASYDWNSGSKAVPKGTTQITYYAYVAIGTKGSLELENMSLIIRDELKPAFATATLYAINGIAIPAGGSVAGTYPAGTTLRYAVKFDEPVIVTSAGTFNVSLSGTTSAATYKGQSADKMTLYYDYVIPTSGVVSDNASVKMSSISGLTVRDDAGNSTTVDRSLADGYGLYMDNKPPEVSSFTTTASANACYTSGDKITFNVEFHEAITVTGSPSISLSNGRSAVYTAGSGSQTNLATFIYTVGIDDSNTDQLTITGVNFAGIVDKVNQLARYSANAYNSFLNNYRVQIDTYAPTVTMSDPGTDWHDRDYMVYLTATDAAGSLNGSGVDELYSVWTTNAGDNPPVFPVNPNVGSSNTVSAPVQSGTYYLWVKAVDRAGNTSATKAPYVYKYDLTPPLVVVTPQTIIGYPGLAGVTVTVSDNESGVASQTYVWQDADAATVVSGDLSDGITYPSTDGEYSLIVTAKDHVGNQTITTVENLYIDKTQPVVSFTPESEGEYRKEHAVSVALVDEKSGIANYAYQWTTSPVPVVTDDGWITTKMTEFASPTRASGSYYLQIRATDGAGNTSYAVSGVFNLDNTAPMITIFPDGKLFTMGISEYEIGIIAEDSVTPTADLRVHYAFSTAETPEGLSWQPLTSSTVTLSKPSAITYLYIQATDLLGNTAEYKSAPFIVDKTAPTGSITSSGGQYLNSSPINLAFAASDDYTVEVVDLEMQLIVDGVADSWSPFATEKSVSFAPIEGVHTISVRYRDLSGNISEGYSTSFIYDVTPPTISIDYEPMSATNTSVTAMASTAEPDLIVGASSYTFVDNGSFSFTATDLAGNVAVQEAKVTWIDKTAPTVTFTSPQFDNKRHKAVSVTISALDNANGVRSLQYRFVQDGVDPGEWLNCDNGATVNLAAVDGLYRVEARAVDGLGNEGTQLSGALYLDNTPPSASVSYLPATRTAQDVQAILSLSEEATITNNDGSNIYIFKDNSSFCFEFVDEAGNTGSQVVTVTWIDRTIPTAIITVKDLDGEIVDPERWVNHDLLVTIEPSQGAVVTNPTFKGRVIGSAPDAKLYDADTNTYLLSSYGVFSFTVLDRETEMKQQLSLTVHIDQTAPVLKSELHIPASWTNGDVTVTITVEDDFSTVTYEKGNTHTFTDNGSHTFYFTDALGNQGEHTVIVTTIDREIPVPAITYTVNGEVYDGTPTNQDVTATITLESRSPAFVTNNGGRNTYVFTGNGEFTFEFANAAGNRGSCVARVDTIDKTPPTVSFSSTAFDGKQHQAASISFTALDANEISAIQYRFVQDGGTAGNWQDCQNGSTVSLDQVDGKYYLEVKAVDGVGNQIISRSEGFYLDNTPPVASIQYSPSTRTARNVTAVVSFNEPASVTNNGGSTSYLFTDNGDFTFAFEDEAGNRGSQTAQVTWIDHNYLEATITLRDTDGNPVAEGTWVSCDLLVTITPPEQTEISHITWEGKAIETVEDNTYTYLVTDYGVLSFTVLATATGVESVDSYTVRIDRTAPDVISERHTPEGWTNGDVTVTITAGDKVSAVTYLNGNSHTFTENGSYTFYFEDALGNQGAYTAYVSNIDKSEPIASVIYTVNGVTYDEGPTNQDVVATIDFVSPAPVTVTNNNGNPNYTFTANGEFTFQFINAAGTRGSYTARATQIDKTPPQVSFTSPHFDGKHRQEVAVTINAADAENGLASLEYRFAADDGPVGGWLAYTDGEQITLNQVDGRYRLQVKAIDEVGNEGISQSEYLYLDNTVPIATFEYLPANRTAQNVQAIISFNEVATIINNGGSRSYVFQDNGSFTFEFVDEVGNRGSSAATVDWIDRNLPNATTSMQNLQYQPIAADKWVNHDLLVTIAPRAHATIADLTWNGVAIVNATGVSLYDEASNTYLVTTYGVFNYTVLDIDTRLERKDSLTVRIDKEAPKYKSELRTPEGWTTDSVTVTIIAEDALTTVSYPEGDSYTFTENGSHTFRFVDAVGNLGEYTVTVDTIEKNPPTPNISFTVAGETHTGEYTNHDVTATISFDSLTPVTITNNGGSSEYTFATNGEFTFEFVNAVGLRGSHTAKVDFIDKTPPTAYVTYSNQGWTNRAVVATLHVSDGQSGAANDGATYTFSENGTYDFTAYDRAGNAKVVTATVTRIDRTPPTLSYTLSTEKRTPYSVIATVAADESVTWLNNSGRSLLQFSSNGSFTFKAQDRAGNVAEITVVVTNITKESTPVVLTYSSTDPTNGNVFVTIAPQDPENDIIFVLNNGGSATHAFVDNGEFTYQYRNPAGITGEAVASVSTIDKLAPIIDLTYSTTELTNGSVTATMTANEPVIWPFGVKDGVLVLTENNKLLIPVTDAVGNVANVLIEVTWIDCTPPVIVLDHQHQAIPVGSSFDTLTGVVVHDDHDLPIGLTYQGEVRTDLPGDYTITYTAIDSVGNTATAYKYVTVYDPNQFNVIINGQMPVNGEVEITGGEMLLETINQGGQLKLLSLPGKKGIGDFKLKGITLLPQHTFTEGGYYTLYIQDDERNTKLVYLFVKL